jgi:general secretion pathway protein N
VRIKPVLILGIVTFLCGLIFYAPAASFYRWTTPQGSNPVVTYYGIQGTLAQGEAAAIEIRGHTILSNLHWTLKPLWLLLAQRAFEITGGGEQAALNGIIRLGPTGATTLSGLHASLSLKSLLAAAGQAFVPMDGQVELDLHSLKLKDNLIKSADGLAQLHNLAWTLAKEPLILGDFEARSTTEGETVTISIKSVSGPLDVSGDIKLTADQNYQANLQFRAKPRAEPVLRNLVSSAGQPDAQGWTHYRAQGRLAP